MALPFLFAEPKHFKTRTTLDSLTDFEVRKHLGLPLDAVQELHRIIGPDLEPSTARSSAISSETKLLTALSFFRSGSFQYIEGTVGGISQPSMSRILEQFCNSLIRRFQTKIHFPNQESRLNHMKSQFYQKARFTNVIGVVDGTHVNIKAPYVDEPNFVNRKLSHSINVQVVSGPNHEFLDVVAQWPGSTHDAYMWRRSTLKQRFENAEFGESWLLGDSGYGVEPWLLTPFTQPQTGPERMYNKSLRITRSLVERAIGIWKVRFRSMDKTGGTLCYEENKCCKLIIASCILHNFCMEHKIQLDAEDERRLQNEVWLQNRDEDYAPTGIEDMHQLVSGILTRENLVLTHFS